MMKRLISALIAAFVSLVATAQPAKEDIIKEIIETGSSMKSLQCAFIQTRKMSIMNAEAVSEGRMHYQQPDKLRWEYVAPFKSIFVLNGTELGGGSIRIHEAAMQERMFEVLGISKEDAEYKFGFIINAFKFGAPPHGGLAFGFDRVCSLFGGQETIRDYIAFPKNNQGRDVMIDSPSYIDQEQMDELFLNSTAERKE